MKSNITFILALIFLPNISFGQYYDSLVYEVINQKIISDSLFVLTMQSNATFISDNDIKAISDSINYKLYKIIDSNNIIHEQGRRWYGDRYISEPILVDSIMFIQIQLNNTNGRWKKKQIKNQSKFKNKIRQNDRNIFSLSRPIFFDNGNKAIIYYYEFCQSLNTRYFLQLYCRNDKGKWEKKYERLLWFN